jgi:manganese/zinc/iron transport system permease protein
MEALLDFFSFADPNVRLVTLGTVLLGAAAAVVGSFAFLRKRALVGDAIAHAILPGIVLAYVLSDSKNTLVLMAGALVSGWVALLSMDYLSNKTKLKTDTVIGLILSVFFGLGIFMLTAVQHTGRGNQAGLDKFLFGKAASMTQNDVYIFAALSIILILLTFVFFKAFKIVAFNRDYALTLGLPVKLAEFVLATLTVLAITTGIQAVGVVLMAALLITPAAAARSWTNALVSMILIAAFLGAFGGLVGSFISYTAPKMPTGPWIVMALSFFALFSLLFAPKRGVFSKLKLQRKNREKIITENFLKAFYLLGERSGNPQQIISREALLSYRDFPPAEFQFALRTLKKNLHVIALEGGWRLSKTGLEEGARVVRLHRLWEMYLTERMNFKSDHIHPNAETMEHVITPELEAELIKELNHPEKDPHESTIPY